ncbi:cytochrome P450 [Aspergillus homomorphus CBS 101889]|uniref:Cytochrome P450 monooxygenase n=1 Tax=Aspergillus homomorphus (strain CBS 101889) TaxID=1450537 RepID=A0A395IDT7_ASPHC|nr:cytochrome P450 monooxygenase [Aspergillus homomorphus CBS 101889]RAL17308.1 cytochrome P450 monooxygenase [Aspergillus homomorphus CBS 101889]
MEALAIQPQVAALLFRKSFLWSLLFSLTLTFICYVFYFTIIYPAWFSPLRHLPKPRGATPILGHALAEFKMPRGNEYLRFMNETTNAGIIHLHGAFGADQLLLTNPAALNEVLVKQPYDFEWPEGDRNFLRRILGRGLITAVGHAHKHQRKQIAQSFGVKDIKSLYPLFWERSRDLVTKIAEELSQQRSTTGGSSDVCGEVDVGGWAQRVTLDVVGEALFGWKFNTLENPDHEFAHSFEQIFEPTIENALLFAVSVYAPPWALDYIPGGVSERFLAATGKVRDVCRAFIRAKSTDDNAPKDLLSQLMTQEGMCEDLLVDQTLTLLTAGHETVAIAFTWAIYLLAKHPDIQSQLRRELRSNLPHHTTVVDGDHLPSTLESLPILNGVVNETLRLYPSAPVAVRVSVRDTCILRNYVPEGTRIIVSPWAVNRSVDLWGPQAEMFMPTRWIDPPESRNVAEGVEAKARPPLLTFLHGPRNCLGQGFAKAELLSLLAVFTRSFEVSMIDPGDAKVPGGALSAKPAGGMRLRLKVVEETICVEDKCL